MAEIFVKHKPSRSTNSPIIRDFIARMISDTPRYTMCRPMRRKVEIMKPKLTMTHVYVKHQHKALAEQRVTSYHSYQHTVIIRFETSSPNSRSASESYDDQRDTGEYSMHG